MIPLYFAKHIIFSEDIRRSYKKLPDGPDTYIQTTNNHAKRGAGIYCEVDNTVTNTPCSF